MANAIRPIKTGVSVTKSTSPKSSVSCERFQSVVLRNAHGSCLFARLTDTRNKTNDTATQELYLSADAPIPLTTGGLGAIASSASGRGTPHHFAVAPRLGRFRGLKRSLGGIFLSTGALRPKSEHSRRPKWRDGPICSATVGSRNSRR
jgi:hypothetical protein